MVTEMQTCKYVKEDEHKETLNDMMKISTNNQWKPVFDIFVLFAVGYSCIYNFFLACYPVKATPAMESINWTIEGLFYIDFVLNFFQTYLDEETF